jgi:hypothetical protein
MHFTHLDAKFHQCMLGILQGRFGTLVRFWMDFLTLLEDNSVLLGYYNISEGNTPMIDGIFCPHIGSSDYVSLTSAPQ